MRVKLSTVRRERKLCNHSISKLTSLEDLMASKLQELHKPPDYS